MILLGAGGGHAARSSPIAEGRAPLASALRQYKFLRFSGELFDEKIDAPGRHT